MYSKKQEFMKHCCMGYGTAEQNEYYRSRCMSAEEVLFGKPVFEMNKREFLEFCVLCENLKKGNLPNGNCPKCRNKGYIVGIDEEGNEYQEDCTCLAARRNEQELERSEYSELLRTKTFERFTYKAEWQREKATACKNWTRQREYPLLALFGKSGTGKTHLGVAAFRIAVARGLHGIFVSWQTISGALKASVGTAEYERKMRDYKYAPLLYIDDFLWRPKGGIPTEADLRIAKEILDARLYNRRKTILTGNNTLREIYSLSEEIAGRLNEYSGGSGNYLLEFLPSYENYRFAPKMEEIHENSPFDEEVV